MNIVGLNTIIVVLGRLKSKLTNEDRIAVTENQIKILGDQLKNTIIESNSRVTKENEIFTKVIRKIQNMSKNLVDLDNLVNNLSSSVREMEVRIQDVQSQVSGTSVDVSPIYNKIVAIKTEIDAILAMPVAPIVETPSA